MTKKYISLFDLDYFFKKIKEHFSLKTHNHTASEIDDLPYIPQKLSDLIDDIGLISNAEKGMIVIWSGYIDNIPAGWQLCDGTNDTPDLRNRFVVGAGRDYSTGNIGGEQEHTLTVNEMPSHKHKLAFKIGNTLTSDGAIFKNATGWMTSFENDMMVDFPPVTEESTGGSQPHNNMPPYYALCYIMKMSDSYISQSTMDTITNQVLNALPTWNGGNY